MEGQRAKYEARERRREGGGQGGMCACWGEGEGRTVVDVQHLHGVEKADIAHHLFDGCLHGPNGRVAPRMDAHAPHLQQVSGELPRLRAGPGRAMLGQVTSKRVVACPK